MSRLLVSLILLVGLGQASAGVPEEIVARFPGATGARIKPAFDGFHSVTYGNQVIFVKDDLSILIDGEVINLNTMQSLSATLRAASNRVDVQRFNVTDAIQVGEGSRRVFLLADPDCPYCQRLEHELSQIDDLQVFVFLYPIGDVQMANNIWCAPDRAEAWRSYLLKGQPPADTACETPVARNLALGRNLGLTGVPVLIFEDGTLIRGAVSAARIATQLDALRKDQ